MLTGRSGTKREVTSIVTDEEHICKLANFILETKRFKREEAVVEGSGE